MFALLLLGPACAPTTVVGEDAATDSVPANDGGDSATPARDLDEDGYDYTVDCLDLNADVHPGATELWNGLDDDCDGVVDADGAWTGTISVSARAIYEGRPYEFSLRCPFAGPRGSGQFAWQVTCTPDPDDPDARRLLGSSFTLSPENPAIEGQSWTGSVIVASADGWDTDADGAISWSGLSAATFTASLDTFSLTMAVAGDLLRE